MCLLFGHYKKVTHLLNCNHLKTRTKTWPASCFRYSKRINCEEPMKATILFSLILLPVYGLMAQDEVKKTNFTVISAQETKVVEKECLFALRKTMTKKEVESKSKYSCYSVVFKNATIETEDGEQMILGEVETAPLVEALSIKTSRECADRLVNGINQSFSETGISKREKIKLPSFEVVGVVDGKVHVATSKNKIFGNYAIGRESFSYENKVDGYKCHPHSDRPSINVVDKFQETVVEDEDVLGGLARSAKGFGWNLLRAGEKAVDYTSRKVGLTVER